MKDLQLYPVDKDSLNQGNWLTDSVINAAQTLLKQQFPHVGGLQEVVLADTLAFEIQGGEFVQILNVRRSHWIAISNIGCQGGVVNVYDSMPNCDLPRRTKQQIAAILFWKKKNFRLQFQAVQEQRGGSDCGLFTVAFATSLCVGDDPTLIS